MELAQLQYFRTVARIQNITQASKVLHISQPALSRAISRLEEELGQPLFDRGGNRINLNPYGVIFLNRVDQAFTLLENSVNEIKIMRDEEYGTINFSAFTAGLVSEPMKKLLLQYPNIHLNHSVATQDAIKVGLENGMIDIALTMYPIESSLVQWEPMAHDELIVLINTEHPLSTQKALDLVNLKGEKLAMVAVTFGIRELLEGACSRVGFSPTISYMGSDNEMAMSLLKENACIYVMPASIHIWKLEEDRRHMAERKRARPFPFRAMRIQNPACSFSYGISVPKERVMSRATFTFYTMLREYLALWDLRCEQEGLEKLLEM